ncbi:MAG: PepSY-like domain-containing protein [Mangrovibacterium sp.]
MKNFKFAVLFAVLAMVVSCSDNDKETILTGTNIPTQITSYQATHFPENPISTVIKDEERKSVSYDVYLQNGIKLEFNSAFEVCDIDGVTKLPDSVIPQEILNYVAKNYPNNLITDWEFEDGHQQVELDNHLELEFNLDGSFIRMDN